MAIDYFVKISCFIKQISKKKWGILFNVLLISLAYFHLGIKVRTIWISTLTGHDHSVLTFYSRCLGSREITKTKVHTFLWNALYEHYVQNGCKWGVYKKYRKILQGLYVAQAAVTKRWPKKVQKSLENHFFFVEKKIT